MTTCFIVRAHVIDGEVKDAFDRAWGDKVTRSREIVDAVQTIGD